MDDAAAVRAAADAFWDAVRAGDGTAIASLMSPEARKKLLEEVRRWIPAVSTPEEAAARVWGRRWPTWLISVPRFVTDSVELDGTRAIARWDVPDLHGEPEADDYVELAKLEGRWVVDVIPDDNDPENPPVWASDF